MKEMIALLFVLTFGQAQAQTKTQEKLLEKKLPIGDKHPPGGMLEANGHGNGGDIDIKRKRELTQKILFELQETLLKIIDEMPLAAIDEMPPREKDKYLYMTENGLRGKVKAQIYEVVNGDLYGRTGDDKKDKKKSAILRKNGNIAFSLTHLASRKADYREVVELAFHEHARQFPQIDDEQQTLGPAILRVYCGAFPKLCRESVLRSKLRPSRNEKRFAAIPRDKKTWLSHFFLWNNLVKYVPGRPLTVETNFQVYKDMILNGKNMDDIYHKVKNPGAPRLTLRFNLAEFDNGAHVWCDQLAYSLEEFFIGLGYSLRTDWVNPYSCKNIYTPMIDILEMNVERGIYEVRH